MNWAAKLIRKKKKEEQNKNKKGKGHLHLTKVSKLIHNKLSIHLTSQTGVRTDRQASFTHKTYILH